MGLRFGKVCYTTLDAARALGVSASTVANWVDAGHLAGHRTAGGHRRIPVDALAAFAALHGMPGVPGPAGAAKHASESPTPARALGTPRLLVVDDDVDFGETVRGYLVRKFGWDIVVVTSAFEAGIRAARETPDAILLDIRLRETDGFAVLEGLRADPALSGAHVYACTGWRDPDLDRRIRGAGFSGCFHKPIDLATLGAVLARDFAASSAARSRGRRPRAVTDCP